MHDSVSRQSEKQANVEIWRRRNGQRHNDPQIHKYKTQRKTQKKVEWTQHLEEWAWLNITTAAGRTRDGTCSRDLRERKKFICSRYIHLVGKRFRNKSSSKHNQLLPLLKFRPLSETVIRRRSPELLLLMTVSDSRNVNKSKNWLCFDEFLIWRNVSAVSNTIQWINAVERRTAGYQWGKNPSNVGRPTNISLTHRAADSGGQHTTWHDLTMLGNISLHTRMSQRQQQLRTKVYSALHPSGVGK